MPDRLLITEIGAYGKIKQIHQQLWSRRFFGPIKNHEETVAEQREKLFGPNRIPIHAYSPHISHALNLLVNISVFPPGNDYSNFFRGLLMSGLLWERRRSKIAKEFEIIQNMMEQNHPSPDEPQVEPDNLNEPSHSIRSRQLTVLLESLFGTIALENEVISKFISEVVVGHLSMGDKEEPNTSHRAKKRKATTADEAE
jgi:hypothetical protein